MFLKDNLREVLGEPLAKARLKEVPAPFSLPSLIAWLEKQPARKTYCYLSNGNCLLAQYFRAVGVPFTEVRGFTYSAGGQSHELPIAFQDTASGPTHTFGAALKRARTFLLQANAVSGSPSNLLAAGV